MNPKSHRIESIDILRGVVMILMALDHVRAFYVIESFGGNSPTNMETTTVMFFLTRFITHFCAPAFVLLAGTSAFLYEQKTSKSAISKFLISRGIWLIVVEVVIITFLWYFDPMYHFINLQVIWAIGISMVILGGVIHFGEKIVFFLGMIILLFHPLLAGMSFEKGTFGYVIYYIMYGQKWFNLGGGYYISIVYSIIPWVGMMMVGYAMGMWYRSESDPTQRRSMLMKVGLFMTAAFFLIRGINLFGDQSPWQSYDEFYKTFISFLNVSKYPASMSFILITLGPSLIFLSWVESFKNKITDMLIVFGRVPFFYYIVHFLFIHGFAVILLYLTGEDGSILILTPEAYSNDALSSYGYSLPIVYLIWIGIVVVLYPICKWFMDLKAKHRGKFWVSYL